MGLKLDMFRLSKMVDNAAIVAIAKRGSGKSILCRDIVYNYRKMPCGVIIAVTDKFSHFYKKFFPDIYIHFEVSQNLLERILYRQTIILDKQSKKMEEGKKLDPRLLLLMDDCMASAKEWKKMPVISEIMMNGRHYKITYVLTMQYGVGIGPEVRGNFDYIFLLKEDGPSAIHKLHEHYAGIFPDKNTFATVFRKCTIDHQCMVIDNRAPKDAISDKVFYFKATYDRDFTFGSRSFREKHHDFFDPDYMKRIIRGSFQASKPSKRGADIDVVLRR